ncbi:MAG: phage major capsid protein, partial [Duncaniella sp.]|nr:phage major capsid protein [Duncaniella sp.]
MPKLTVKEVEEIVGIKTAGLPDEQKQFITSLVGAFTDAVNKSIEGVLDTTTLKEALKPFQSADGVTLDSLSKENADLVKQVKSLSDALDKLKKRGLSLDFVSKFNERFDEMY